MSQTDWSMIRMAASEDGTVSEPAWERVARRYWPAVYAFVRRSGHGVEDAADLTQGFICDIMMGRDLIGQADPDRGRFRTLLRTAIRNYLTEQHRHAHRRKRRPEQGHPVSLDHAEGEAQLGKPDETPDEAFARSWSTLLIRHALSQMEEFCRSADEHALWEIFSARIARPLLQEGPPVPYDVLVKRLGLRNTAQAVNIAVTARRRFVRLLRNQIRVTVEADGDIDKELAELIRELELPR